MADQIVITDEEAVKTVTKYAEQKEISKAEAGARLIRTAKGRINAVRKYAAEHPAKKVAKKVVKKAVKKEVKKEVKKVAKAPVKRAKKADASAAPVEAVAAAPQP
jgi:hypothetical protein